MSKGHPYRYDQGLHDRHRGRFGQQDARRDPIGSPYKRQRRSSSSGNDFTTFSYEDCHQEVGLGNFNDFSAISRETILERDRRRDVKPSSSQSMSALTVQTSRSNSGNKSASKISPLSVKISPSGHLPSKSSTSQKCGTLISSFKHTDRQPSHSRYVSQPMSPYQPESSSTTQYGPKVESSQSSGHVPHTGYHVTRPNQPTGLLMQVSSGDVNSSFAGTNAVTPVKEDVYQPKVEAVSPTYSETEAEKANDEPSKEADNKLLKQMEKVDKEISEVEKKISDLKEKQETLQDELTQDALQAEEDDEEEEEEKNKENENVKQENGIEDKIEVEVIPPEPKEKTLIERIYEENRQKAAAAHERFAKIGIPLPTALPLYNQPSDLPFYEENRTKARAVQLKLVKYFQRKRREKQLKQRALLEEYRVLHKKWMEKVEKMENNQKRKNKEARIRDSYEKIFPEIRRHREQTERFSRIGSRNWGMSARSDAEYEEILRDLEEKERHEKHMRELAVDPPPILDEHQRRVKYIDRNGLIKDLKVYVEQRRMLNIWTEKEKEIFKEKYIEAPKDFQYIAEFISNKSVKDCVLYYYRTKRTGNYKKLAKKQSLKRKRLPHSTGKDETSKSKILKPRSEGYRSESDIEDEELPFDEDSDGSEGSASRVPVSTSVNPPSKITIPQPGSKAEPDSVETPRWSTEEREIAIEGLRLHGRNWTAIAHMVKRKTEAQCKNFYFNYKRKLDLENIIAEHNASKIQRQESEETISASEASDDAYDIPEERPSVVRSKQNARETRSQAAERRVEPTTGPTLRNSRGQRNTRNKSSDGKPLPGPDDPSNAKLHEVDDPVTADNSKTSTADLDNACSDETRIIVVDTVEPGDKQEQVEVVGGFGGPRAKLSPMESYVRVSVPSSAGSEAAHFPGHSIGHQIAAPSQAVVKGTITSSDRPLSQTFKTETHGNPRNPNVELSCTTNPSTATVNPAMFTSVPYAEALQNFARSRAAAESVGHVDNRATVEEPGDKNEKEKLKNLRFPDPQLTQIEQHEAIGIFSRYSPCIPPDTTSRQQVRTQRVPHPSFHPAGIPMHPFVPHIGPHGAHFPPEMFVIPHGPPGFDPMYHPQFLEYLHPGMEHNLFSARLREEAVRANPGAMMWPPMDPQAILFAPHPFMIPAHMEPLTPTELIPRRIEGPGHELMSPVSSTRCRSVETPLMYRRARTPEQQGITHSKPMNQQRSASLTDVHSWVGSGGHGDRHTSPSRLQAKSAPSPKDPTPDQVKSYEPFTALMNAAVGARPIESLKIGEAERPQAQFTRQSCVVTNTTVLHVTSGPKDTSGQQAAERHGISSGLAPPQPPPLLSITGTYSQHPRNEPVPSNSRSIETNTIGRIASREVQESPRVVHPREMTPREITPGFSHSPKEQHPPPLVRDTPDIGTRRTPPTVLLGRPTPDILPCGCRSTEPCKHQLYSQEVPYVQRDDARSWQDVDHKQSTGGIENTRDHEPNRGSKSIFRPWTENIVKGSAKPSSPLKTVSPTTQLQPKQLQRRSSGSPLGDHRTPPPGVLLAHSYSQQPGVLMSHPPHQQDALISRPSSQQRGEAAPRPDTHDRSSNSLDNPQFASSQPLAQERCARSIRAHHLPQEIDARSFFTSVAQESAGLARQPGSSTSHPPGLRPSDSSSLLPPQLLGPRNKSPNLVFATSQPNDQSTVSAPRGSHEPSIIKSLKPRLSGVHSDSPRHLPSTRPISPFPLHSERFPGTSHLPSMVPGMTDPQRPRGTTMPTAFRPLSNQPTRQEPSHPPQFLPTSQHLSEPLRPDIMYSGNSSSLASDGTRLPRPVFEQATSSVQSRAFSEQARTSSEQARTSSEQSRVFSESRTSSEQSRTFSELTRTSPEQFRTFSEQPESVNVQPEPSRVSPTSVAVSQFISQGLVKPPSLVDKDEVPRSPFVDQVELHQPRFDAPVDIQRHVNPSYAAKTDIEVQRSSPESREDVSKLSESTTTTGTSGNITGTVSPPQESPASRMSKQSSSSEQRLRSVRVASNRSGRDVDIDEDSREDSRSITGSSSVGFESPDDEDHELRMRFFPLGDVSDSGGDILYGTEDPTSDQPTESNELESSYSDKKQIDDSVIEPDSTYVEDIPEKHKSPDEFSNTDGTCIPTDSTYIDFSERSANEGNRSNHGYDSSAEQDMVDSTVSNFSEFEQPSEVEMPDEEQDESCKDIGGSLADTEFDAEDANFHSDDDVSKEHVTSQDETGSGIEGGDDATEDDEAGSSGEETDNTADRVHMDTESEVRDTRDSEVDSSGDGEVKYGKNDDGIVMDNTGGDRIVLDTKGEMDTTEGETEGDSTVVDSKRDTLVCDEESVEHNRVYDGAKENNEKDFATREEAGELRNIVEPGVRTTREDEGALGIDETGLISGREESLNSTGDEVRLAFGVGGENRDVTFEVKNTLDSRLRDSTVDASIFLGEPTNAREVLVSGINNAEKKNVDIRIDVEDSVNDDSDIKVTSSSALPLDDVSDDESISEASQSQIVEDNHRQPESESNIPRDEDSVGVRKFDSVDSSTDRKDDQVISGEETATFVEDNLAMNQPGGNEECDNDINLAPTADSGGMDIDSSRDLHVTSSEEHVTSSNEHVIGRDEDMRSSEEHVTGRDEHVISSEEHVTERDEHVISSLEQADSKTTLDQSNMGDEDMLDEVKVSQSATPSETRGHVMPGGDHVDGNHGNESSDVTGDTTDNDKSKEQIAESTIRDESSILKANTTSRTEGEHEMLVGTTSAFRDSVSSETIGSRLGDAFEEMESDHEALCTAGQESEGRGENVHGGGEEQGVATEVSSRGEIETPGDEITGRAVETNERDISKDDQDTLVTSAEGGTFVDIEDNEDLEGGGIHEGPDTTRNVEGMEGEIFEGNEDLVGSGIHEGPDTTRDFEDMEGEILGDIEGPDTTRDVNYWEGDTSVEDQNNENTCSTGEINMDESSATGPTGITESTSREAFSADQEDQLGHRNVINDDITSTVGESQMNIVSQRNDTDISSTFDTSTGNHQHRLSPPGEADRECTQASEIVSSCVATSSVAMQRDDVATSSEIPNISDVSSSDASECAENAVSRASSSQIDSTGFRNDLQDFFNLSRRSSEESTSNSEERPTTSNLNDRKPTTSDIVTDDHDSNDVDLSGNEAESIAKYDEGESGIVGDKRRPSLNERNNFVDSSTVSPVSFTDDISHTWSSADTSVDTTGYLGIIRHNAANLSTTESTVDTTDNLGIDMDNSGRVGTSEDTVGTSLGITSSGKYDITVEAISSDEEELEEGEIAATPGEPDDVTNNDVTSGNVIPGDVTPEHMITSSGSYYPPLDTIPISPPADTDEPSTSSSAFLEFGSFLYSSTQHASQLAGSLRVSHSVFPYSALNLRSAPNSNCSSPIPLGFSSGSNTPIRFQPADSSNILTGQYEPLSDDDETGSELQEADEQRHSARETDSS